MSEIKLTFRFYLLILSCVGISVSPLMAYQLQTMRLTDRSFFPTNSCEWKGGWKNHKFGSDEEEIARLKLTLAKMTTTCKKRRPLVTR